MIQDERHALYCGWVLGIAMNNGLDLRPVVDEQGNFTDALILAAKGLGQRPVTITVIVPPPPDDWVFPDA